MQNILNINFSDMVPGAIIFVLVAIVIFLILREFVTWYWKLNKISDTLERIEILLQDMSPESKPINIQPVTPVTEVNPQITFH
jgi:hypothetical protein